VGVTHTYANEKYEELLEEFSKTIIIDYETVKKMFLYLIHATEQLGVYFYWVWCL